MPDRDPTRPAKPPKPPKPMTSAVPAELLLPAAVTAELRTRLPEVAERTVNSVTAEVPGYAGALRGEMRATIEGAVQLALGGFLNLASRPRGTDPATPVGPAIEGAYALGRGEARSGRTMEALLSAYRVGARVAWQEFSGAAVAAGLDAGMVARFAELVFAYIDQLSAASVAGHSDELATTGRVRERYLERLGRALVAGAAPDALHAAAERAEWEPPTTLTAAIITRSRVPGLLARLDQRVLAPTEDLPGLAEDDAVLLVPDAHGRGRARLLADLVGTRAVVGPARPWLEVSSSWARALRTRELGLGATGRSAEAVDTERHLATLVLAADPVALADLRTRALAPLSELRPAVAEKLTETLRSWLLHHGRRDAVAAELFVHPQTVRYRVGQLRELFGERLEDPQSVLELTLALA